MKIALYLLLIIFAFAAIGCNEKDSDINLRTGVRNDSLTNNTVVTPVAFACSALLGEGVAVDETSKKVNDDELLEFYVKGHNNSQFTKRFWYRPKWIDADGMTIQSRTSVWMPMSVTGKSKFNFKVVAPTTKAVNVKMDTKKWE